MNGWTLEPASIEEWIEAWSADPNRTRFQHPDWHRVFAQTWPESFHLAAYRLLGPDGTDSILPGSTRRLMRGLATEWISSPGHTYGGMLGNFSGEAYRAAQYLLLKKHASYHWSGSPFDESLTTMNAFTQIVDMNLPAEELDASIDHSRNLYHARKAERSGLRLHRWSGDAEAFYSIYTDARNRWDLGAGARNAYPIDLLNRIFMMDGAEIWAVTMGDDPSPVAMGIFLVAGSHVDSWLPLALQSALEFRPYQFMYVNLIRHYHQRGFTKFDFNPSAGLSGVIEFKSRFGAKRIPYQEYSGQRAWVRLLRTIRKI